MNAMLVSSGASLNLWEEVIFSTCHIQNRITYKWGCLIKVLLLEPKKRKLGPKTFDATFIGYAENSAYRFLVIKSENGLVEVNSTIETNNANFFEHIFPWKGYGNDMDLTLDT